MSGWKIHFEVRNIGDDRGITSHLSEANFKFKIKGYTVLQGHEWIGNLFLGDRMSWRVGGDGRYDRLGEFGMTYLNVGDSITFQATTKTILFEGMAIPSGSRLGRSYSI